MNSGRLHPCMTSILLCLFFGFLIPTAVSGQSMSLSGGNINLTFSAPTAGSDLDDVVDNTSCDLVWNRPSGPGTYRITVQSTLDSPRAQLTVRALNVDRGTSSGQVILRNFAINLVTNILVGDGGCDLEFTASVSLTDGIGTDVHTVTYTYVY